MELMGLATDTTELLFVTPEEPPSKPEPTANTAYLMAYFGPQEKLFYAYSRDARNWIALNDGQPVFDAGVRLRDPFINRANGTFHLVHTKAWDNPVIFHWQSNDLINWKGGEISVVPTEKKRAWAPEFFYSDAEQLSYVFWASEHNGHNAIHYLTTKDWTDITPTQSAVYYDLGIDDIDFTVVSHDKSFYAFHKPGSVADMMGNKLLISQSLDPSSRKFFQLEQDKEVLPDSPKPIEGPQIIQVAGSHHWYIYGDPFDHPMEAWETTDFTSFSKITITTPKGAKHCSMFPISETVLNALLQKFPPTKAE